MMAMPMPRVVSDNDRHHDVRQDMTTGSPGPTCPRPGLLRHRPVPIPRRAPRTSRIIWAPGCQPNDRVLEADPEHGHQGKAKETAGRVHDIGQPLDDEIDPCRQNNPKSDRRGPQPAGPAPPPRDRPSGKCGSP